MTAITAELESACTDTCTLGDPTVPTMCWGFKLVGLDLATYNHQGGRYRYRPGQWHRADPGDRKHNTTRDCPTFPGDGLCIARTLAGAQSGGQRLGASVMLIVGYLPGDVLYDRGGTKLRVRRLWVHPDTQDPTQWALGAGANLADANLADANLTRANLARANLTRANLTRANLARANLARANLTRANLARANLARADLTRAYLGDANLADANLAGANLADANLTRAYVGSKPSWLPGGWTVTANGYIVREEP